MFESKELNLGFWVTLLSAMLFVFGILYKYMQGDFEEEILDNRAYCVVIYPDDYISLTSLNDERVEELNQLFYSLGGKKTYGNFVEEGKLLFEGNCKQCHAKHQQVVGPELGKILQKQKLAWLLSFIKNPEKMIKKKDAHAVEMYKKYKQIMPSHDFLSDDQILAILVYLHY